LKRWLPLVGLAPVIWLGLYITFWLDRTSCVEPAAACLGNAFGNWAGDVVMFAWVDTTLGAGLLAFGAGAFVYLTARYQRQSDIADASANRREDVLAALSQLSLKIDRLVTHTLYSDWIEARSVLKSFEVPLVQFSRYTPGAAQWLQLVIGEIDYALGRDTPAAPFVRPNTTKAIAYAIVVEQFFYDHERLVLPDGRYRHIAAEAPALRARLADVGLEKVSLRSLPLTTGMFVEPQ
jgi:hypothetical protein